MSSFSTTAILDAMRIIAESQNRALQLDKTIIAKITSIVNLESGEYKVTYEGNIFSVFASSPTITYEIDDMVYVKIPQNNMSNRKIIDGLYSKNQTLTDIAGQQTDINQVGPTWNVFYGYDYKNEYGVVAGADPIYENDFKYIWRREGHNTDTADAFFYDYSRNYSHIKIKASFLTRFMAEHTTGNYGIIITFRVNTVSEDDPTTVSYRLDISNFVGTPYSYTTWAPQEIIIETQQNYLLGLDSILLFQEDFEQDVSRNYSGQEIYRNDGRDNNYNILVKDIELSFVELVDLTDSVYFLDISTPNGISIITDFDRLPLIGKLKYSGSDIMSKNTCKCYWYKLDPEIMIGHEKYDALAGPRWLAVGEEDGYEIDFSKLIVPADEVKYHNRYKLVTIYNDVQLEKEIDIYRYNSLYDLRLAQETDGDNINIIIRNNNGYGDLLGDWYFNLPDGSYSLVMDDENELCRGRRQIKVNRYLIYKNITFYCKIYNGDELVAVESLTIFSSSSEDDVSISYEGFNIYQYDANGDLAYEDTEVDRTLKATITWKEGFGSAYRITWLAPDGHDLSENNDILRAYSPRMSMMENLWVDSLNVLHYNIKQKYELNYNNNIIIIRITTVDGKVYEFSKEILFMKDGDQGTNGTTYICVVRPVDISSDSEYNKASGVHGLAYYNDAWRQDLNVRCYVYRNGELINKKEQEEYRFRYKWEFDAADREGLIIDSIPGFATLDDYRTIKGNNELDATGYYLVKVTVDINKLNEHGETLWSDNTSVYCQYPIDIIVGELDMSRLSYSLPSYVKYTSSGVDPAYIKDPLRCIYDGIEATYSSTNPVLFEVEEIPEYYKTTEETQYWIAPAAKFFYTQGIAAIKCDFGNDNYLLHPVMMYLNPYGNEAINGWDGTSIEVEGSHILAPQIGAGEKDAQNRFSGVVMGQDSTQKLIGLYGYNKGVSTFGFRQDGTAYIGATGEGQIIFDGNKKGIIQSGNYERDVSGMKIELTNGLIDSFNFKLRSGHMTLDSETQRFLFNIDSESNSSSYFRITAGDSATTLFNVAKNSYYMRSLNFSQTGDYTTIQGVYIDLQNGMFRAGGSAQFAGTIYSTYGEIGGFTIARDSLSSMYVSLTPSYLSVGDFFYADRYGVTLEGSITATSGKIGDWNIMNGSLVGTDIALKKNGIFLHKGGGVFDLNAGMFFGFDQDNKHVLYIQNSSVGANAISISATDYVSVDNTMYFNVDATNITFKTPANHQEGIYARFA